MEEENRQKKVIAIIGTRKRDTSAAFKLVREAFDKIYEEGDWICSGGCSKGADRYAEQLAKAEGIPILIFWPNNKKYHFKVAPLIRNGDIAKEATHIVACVMNPEDGIDKVLQRTTGGTEDTLKKYAIKLKKSKEKVYLV